jgi:hypothetical protein
VHGVFLALLDGVHSSGTGGETICPRMQTK